MTTTPKEFSRELQFFSPSERFQCFQRIIVYFSCRRPHIFIWTLYQFQDIVRLYTLRGTFARPPSGRFENLWTVKPEKPINSMLKTAWVAERKEKK